MIYLSVCCNHVNYLSKLRNQFINQTTYFNFIEIILMYILYTMQEFISIHAIRWSNSFCQIPGTDVTLTHNFHDMPEGMVEHYI